MKHHDRFIKSNQEIKILKKEIANNTSLDGTSLPDFEKDSTGKQLHFDELVIYKKTQSNKQGKFKDFMAKARKWAANYLALISIIGIIAGIFIPIVLNSSKENGKSISIIQNDICAIKTDLDSLWQDLDSYDLDSATIKTKIALISYRLDEIQKNLDDINDMQLLSTIDELRDKLNSINVSD